MSWTEEVVCVCINKLIIKDGNFGLTWAWIMYMHLFCSEWTSAETTSSLYFSIRRQMPVKSWGFLVLTTLMWASRPKTFSTTLADDHVLNTNGISGVPGNTGLVTMLLVCSARKASLDGKRLWGEIMELLVMIPLNLSSFWFSRSWTVSCSFFMWTTASSTIVDLSACRRNL